MRRASPRLLVLSLLVASAACGGGGEEDTAAPGDDPLLRPASETMNRRAPDVYRVVFVTSEGPVTVEVHRAWAPRGADRLYNLARHGFFEGGRFFRVVEGFVAQFGLSGRPEVDRAWRSHPIPDDSVRRTNARGTLTFASAGEDTRTTQLFFNLADNARLDGMGFAPVGEVVGGMEHVDSLYAGYGEGPPRGEGPSQSRILEEGNAYLAEAYPRLDSIREARVVEGPVPDTPGSRDTGAGGETGAAADTPEGGE